MNNGFYTALGTALDKNGNFIPNAYAKQVEDQIANGASGLFCMGSMGMMTTVKNSEYRKVAESAANTAGGKCAVLVGVMDNSIHRVLDRIDALKGLAIDGVVSHNPFTFAPSQEEIVEFFTRIADASSFPVYLYDHEGITQVAFATETVVTLMQHKNIKGIKTANLNLARVLLRHENLPADFDVIYSGLDTFDLAYESGVKKNLDGMFSCMPIITGKMYKALQKGDFAEAGDRLDDILFLRNTFIKTDVFRGFTYAMNFLGYEGIYSPDYVSLDNEGAKEIIKEAMQKLHMI